MAVGTPDWQGPGSTHLLPLPPDVCNLEPEAGAEDGQPSYGCGLGPKYSRSEAGQMKPGLPKEIALHSGPAAFGSNGQDNGFSEQRDVDQPTGRLVIVQGDPGRSVRQARDHGREFSSVSDLGQAGGKSLFGSADQVTTNLPGGPKRAAGIPGIASGGQVEVYGADPQSGGFLQDFAGGLRPGETDHQDDGLRTGDRRSRLECKLKPVVGQGLKKDLAPGAVDDPPVEGISLVPPEHLADMDGSWVVQGQRSIEVSGIKEDQVHTVKGSVAIAGLACPGVEVLPSWMSGFEALLSTPGQAPFSALLRTKPGAPREIRTLAITLEE